MTIFGIKFLDFAQKTLSTTWTIDHDFGTEPVVEVLAHDTFGNLQKAFPLSIIHNSENQILITWTTPRTGQVKLISNQ